MLLPGGICCNKRLLVYNRSLTLWGVLFVKKN
nr:MAG TPA: hypothetical protein [Caudoviricetes sp.]